MWNMDPFQCEGVFNTAFMRGAVNLTSFYLLTAVISLSKCFPLIESYESTIVEFFFCYLSKWESKNISVVRSHSLILKFTKQKTTYESQQCEKGILFRENSMQIRTLEMHSLKCFVSPLIKHTWTSSSMFKSQTGVLEQDCNPTVRYTSRSLTLLPQTDQSAE